MENDMVCIECGYDLNKYASWEYAGKTIQCDNCGIIQVVCYDEIFDGEEEHGWFYISCE